MILSTLCHFPDLDYDQNTFNDKIVCTILATTAYQTDRHLYIE